MQPTRIFSARAVFSQSSSSFPPAGAQLLEVESAAAELMLLLARRKNLRLQLLAATVAELATWGIVQCDFLGQVVVAAVSLASEAERDVLVQLLQTVSQGESCASLIVHRPVYVLTLP